MRALPKPRDGRVETGVVQFGGDWPGVFVRGDDALALAHQIDALFRTDSYHPNVTAVLERVQEMFKACRVCVEVP